MNDQAVLPIHPNAVYTYQQLQYILGVKKTTLSRLIRQNEELQPIVLGKSYRFLGESILDFLKSHINQQI